MKGNRLSVSVIFAIILLTLCLPFSQVRANSYKFRIDSVKLRDDSGVERYSYTNGEFIFVDATITNIMAYSYASEPFLMLARMMKVDTMWGLGAFKASLMSGSSISAAPGILINAPAGTYKMTVFVWSDWASLGGYPVAAFVEVTFTIT